MRPGDEARLTGSPGSWSRRRRDRFGGDIFGSEAEDPAINIRIKGWQMTWLTEKNEAIR
jgi:hypothetical protein